MDEKQLRFFGSEGDENTKRRYTVILPLDTLILLSIVVVLLFILSFSLGVEKGRKIVYLNTEEQSRVFDSQSKGTSADTAIEPLRPSPAVESASKTAVVSVSPPVIKKDVETVQKRNPVIIPQPVKVVIPTKDATAISKRYRIQVASYRENEKALREAKKLEKKGYPVFVSQKGEFVAVFVGEFNNKQEAQKNERLLKETYADCLLRSL
jgi:cell division septation protein DedD